MKIEVLGIEELSQDLRAKSEIRWEAVCKKSVAEIHRRAKNGGTPIDSGELRLSVGVILPSIGFSGEVGYIKDYAPHVEYGHRTINGGFIQGQHYLKDNVETQKPIFKQDLINQITRF